MADFPNLLQLPPKGTIHTSSLAALAGDACVIANVSFTTGGTWPAANRALFIPFLCESTVTVYQMAFEVTVQSGNYDIGIYTEQGSRVVSLGSTAVPAAGIAKANIADTVLKPGLYYMALNIDNTTAAVARSTGPALVYLRLLGIQQQAVGAVTLPDPATFANPSSAYLPAIALTINSTI